MDDVTDRERAIESMNALSRATWFQDYLEKHFREVRAVERRRCMNLMRQWIERGRPAEALWTLMAELENDSATIDPRTGVHGPRGPYP